MSSARGDDVFHIADLFEAIAGAVPDRPALIAGDVRLTFRELDEMATDVADHLIGLGCEPGDALALWGRNSASWVVTMLGAMKARLMAVNINFRYTAGEAAEVLSDCQAVVLAIDDDLLPLLPAVAERGWRGRDVLRLGGGDGRSASPLLTPNPGADRSACATIVRSSDDRYLLYTGGTTGAPRGVVWRHEDILRAAILGIARGGRTDSTIAELVATAPRPPKAHLVLGPMMHGNGQWNLLGALLGGDTAVLWSGRRFEPAAVWDLAEAERVARLAIVGDVMARPLLTELEASGKRRDLMSVRAITSGGAVLSPDIANRLAAALGGIRVVDGFGSSETGGNGQVAGWNEGQAQFSMSPDMAVLDDDLEPVPAGSGRIGWLARTGAIPLEYLGDAGRSAQVFRTDARGRRWAILGDAARPEESGLVTVLGRGSSCINTGGEKVYPDEVERALKAVPHVDDALVVGAPDERLGECVVAVVAGDAHEIGDVRAQLRDRLAAYKVPRRIVFVDSVRRSPAGKPDLAWARHVATGASGADAVGGAANNYDTVP